MSNNLWDVVNNDFGSILNIGNSQLNYTGLSGFQRPTFPYINIAQILAFKKAEILAQGIQLSVNSVPADDWTTEDISKLNVFFIDLQKDNDFNG